MNHPSNLKLIAIILPEPLYTLVMQQQQYIAEHWGPKHALRTPPHLTIIPPIEIHAVERESLWQTARKIAGSTPTFHLKFEGYGVFKPKVVFIQPVMVPAFDQLYHVWRKEILNTMPQVLKRYPDRPFHPHLTLAHRDVNAQQFKEIWAHYADKTFSAEMECKSFCILRHLQHGWEKEEEFFFASNS